jgi:hypothetical protein
VGTHAAMTTRNTTARGSITAPTPSVPACCGEVRLSMRSSGYLCVRRRLAAEREKWR